MFLFRKRKEDAENPEDLIKLEENARPEKPAKTVKPAGPARLPVKDIREKAVKKAGTAAPAKDPFFQSEDSLQIIESDTPVKVVIPASSLIEDEIIVPPGIKEPALAADPVDEEVVDGLFEKVNEGRGELEEDISLDAILPIVDKKTDSKPAERAPAPAKAPVKANSQPVAAQTAAAQPVKAVEAAADEDLDMILPGAADGSTPAEAAVTATANAAANAAAANASAASALASAASALASATAAGLPGAATPEAEKPSGGDEKEKKKDSEEESKENLFSALFNKVEEAEETPLDRLIKTLPEISIEEVMNEAEEVKGLMSEWYQNQQQ